MKAQAAFVAALFQIAACPNLLNDRSSTFTAIRNRTGEAVLRADWFAALGAVLEDRHAAYRQEVYDGEQQHEAGKDLQCRY